MYEFEPPDYARSDGMGDAYIGVLDECERLRYTSRSTPMYASPMSESRGSPSREPEPELMRGAAALHHANLPPKVKIPSSCRRVARDFPLDFCVTLARV